MQKKHLNKIYNQHELYNIRRAMWLDKNKTCYIVYFLRNEYSGLLKIGVTKDIVQRIKQLKSNFTTLGLKQDKLFIEHLCIIPPFINHFSVEKYYHNLFSDYKSIGEWFDIDQEILRNVLCIDGVIDNITYTIEDDYDYLTVEQMKIHECNDEDLDCLLKNKMGLSIRFQDLLASDRVLYSDMFDYVYILNGKSLSEIIQYTINKTIKSYKFLSK